MTTEQLNSLEADFAKFTKTLREIANELDARLETPPVPPIPARYASEFAHEEPPRYAQPKSGEWLLDRLMRPYRAREDMFGYYWILRKLEKPPMPKAPEGYELTGEWRKPKRGEWYREHDGRAALTDRDFTTVRTWILRRLPDRPPAPAPANECWWCESRRKWITVSEVYCTRPSVASDVFRPPTEGERYYGADDHIHVADQDEPDRFPRLILRPIPPAPKRRKLTFSETDNFDLHDRTYIQWKCEDGIIRNFRKVEEQ